MPKKEKARIRNWGKYNKALVSRGSLTLWFEPEALKNWHGEKTGSRGRPCKYGNAAILCMLMIKGIFKFDLRRTQGFVMSLMDLLGINLEVVSYTQLSRRQSKVKLPDLPVKEEHIHMVMDSTGLKIYGEGEWLVRQHGYSKRRTWRKFHIGVDVKSQEVVCAELTANDCGDDKLLPTLLNSYKGELSQVSADGAYDSHACYEEIVSRGARPTIPPQANSKHKPKQEEQLKKARDFVAWEAQKMGLKEWKKSSGYHKRSLVETAFFRFKQLLGDKLSARNFDKQQVEAKLRCHLLNKMTALGMPTY